MNHDSFKSIWDVLLFGIPLLVALFFGHFRLDEVFSARKPAKVKPKSPLPQTAAEVDESSMYKDPDGRAWD